jgi:hypothetical protein
MSKKVLLKKVLLKYVKEGLSSKKDQMDQFQRAVKAAFPNFFTSLEEKEKIKIELE